MREERQVGLRSGALVVLEGLDSAGKSTQAMALVERFRRSGPEPNQLHMPSGDTTVTRAVYQAMEAGSLESSFAHQLLHLACHAENVDRVAALRGKGGLLLDRWWWSTWAYGVRSADLTEDERRALRDLIDVVWGDETADLVFMFLHPFSVDQHNVTGVEDAYWELVDLYPDLAVVVPESEVHVRTEFMLSELERHGLLR